MADDIVLAEIQRFGRQLTDLHNQGSDNATELRLLRQQLLGSEEDKFEAGRLPRLETDMRDVKQRVKTIEAAQEVQTGEKKVLRVVLRWAEKLALAGAGAWFGVHGGHVK